MKITVNTGEEKSRWLRRSRVLGTVIKPLLDAQVFINRCYLALHKVPPLYSSGVRYQEEPLGTDEEFACIPVILGRGWGDCDDLAPWRVAELQHAGEKAKIRIQWKKLLIGGRKTKLFHILVRREDGTIEDPSRILGMP